MRQILCLLMISCFILGGCGKTSPSTKEQPPADTEKVGEQNDSKNASNPVQIENPDFRNIKWGMSPEEVKNSESEVYVKTNEYDEDNYHYIAYDTTVADYPAKVVYRFDNNKLIDSAYFFNLEHSNENLWIDDYNDLKSRYTLVYGEPISSEEVWQNDLYKDSPNDFGLAISAGHLEYTSVWETETTRIGIVLSGDNYEIHLNAGYMPINYNETINTDGI